MRVRPVYVMATLSIALGAAVSAVGSPQQSQPTTGTATAGAQTTTTPATTGRGRGGRGAGRGNVATGPYAPETLPGKGLAEHNFMFAGEHAPLEIFLIKDGKVAWQYTHPKPSLLLNGRPVDGEISDAKALPNGNILFAYQFGAAIVSPDKKVVWSFEAPKVTKTDDAGNTTSFQSEIHTADAVGTDKVAVVENGLPPKLVVLNMADNKEVSSFTLPAARAAAQGDIHAQFRRMRVLPDGKFLVCHMDMGAEGKVVEYDKDGKAGWSVTIQSPWSAERLANGNTLIASNSNFVREVNPKGETVWEFRPADAPGYRIFNTQTAQRLPNGNTVISNWHPKDAGGEPAQFIEVTPDKKVVWALRSWTDPNLGVSTNFQLIEK